MAANENVATYIKELVLEPIDSGDTPEFIQGDYLADFKHMWQRAMAGFRNNAPAGSVLIFAPELLSHQSYYAQVLLYQEIANAAFNR